MMKKEDLENLKNEVLKLKESLTSPPDSSSNFRETQAKISLIEKILFQISKIEALLNNLNQAEEIINKETEPQLLKLAQEEKEELKQKINSQIKELQELRKKLKDEKESYNNLIMEIRAGTGGEEAALFSADLFRMYQKYSKEKGWEIRVLDSSPTSIGGFKEIIFEIRGPKAYEALRFEGGVHRVQRVPETEKSGRIHTSTATVAVLPKPKAKEIKVNPQDIKIETFKASGPGGQYVNKRETAVRITHLPTGIVVSSQSERSLNQNKENALSILEAKLLEIERQKAQAKMTKERRTQIKHAERPEKIRTYNFPQNRVTDHRIKKSWKNLDEVLEGKLDPIIEALKSSLDKN